MAVYTALDTTDVSTFLQSFGFNRLTRLHASASGIENTNYFVDAEDVQGQSHPLVLTLFERGDSASLPYFIELTTYLSSQGLPVPSPYRDHQQQALHLLKGKACLLVPRFTGVHPDQPTLAQCQAIGSALARMHHASAGFSLRRDNDRGPQWRQQVCKRLLLVLPASQAQLLQEQVQRWHHQLPALAQLPSGITHGDLFRDNALFENDQLTGIIDFYNACHDVFIYDLAVLVNDWCSNTDWSLRMERVQAVLQGYAAVRTLTAIEKQAWSAMLCFAALRFWLSRLENWHFPSSRSAVQQKDPEPMRQLLLHRINTAVTL